MPVHACPGLGTRPLASYLGALGLARVVGEQVDPGVRFGWSDGTFTLRTTESDLIGFLVDRYRPTPVVSPWNGGSGFGAKDKSQLEYVERIAATTSARLADYRATIAAARQVLGSPGARYWDKDRLVQELRNWVPDAALPWLDASVVLTANGAEFPPLLGTGGNDGRLDYSSNFHQRLADVLPELGAPEQPSHRWAQDLLHGTTSAALVRGAVGQFDPQAAGGPASSAYGAADSVVNPWGFILMVEGITWFASTPARRLAGGAARFAAMPFTVHSSSDGPIPGAAKEHARGELWAPVFEAVTLPHLRRIMSEARASWHGATAQTVPAMYGAVHTFGVDRGILAFERFGFLQRNGQAFVAAPLDRVQVTHAPEVAIASAPVRRSSVFKKAPGQATETAVRHFDAAATAYLRDPSPDRLARLLARQTRLEVAATRAHGNHGNLVAPMPLARAGQALVVLAPLLSVSPEARVAAGLASAMVHVGGEGVDLRRLLIGSDPGQPAARPVVLGLGIRSAVRVIGDLMVWSAQHSGRDPRLARGWLPVAGHRYRTHWTDVHAWAGGLLDESLVDDYLLAFLALDWRFATTLSSPRRWAVSVDPGLAVLQAFASGQIVGPSVPAEAADGRRGLDHDWPMRLWAGHVHSVCRDAALALDRGLVRVGGSTGVQTRRYTMSVAEPYVGQPGPSLDPDPTRGGRLLAALAAPASTGAMRAVAARADR